MRTGYTSSADLARELAAVWAKRDRVAYPRPYNRWKWDESQTWWVVPAPDQLAFRYSKIIVSSSPRLAQPDELFVGLYVEKGIGAALAAAGYYPEEWVIKPTWRWHGVLSDLAAGALGPAIADASRRIGDPVEIRIDAHVPVVKAAIQPPHDILAYESVDGVAISAMQDPILATEQRFLRGATLVHNLPELADVLQTIPASDSAWINLYVGRSLQKSGLHDESALDAHELTDRLLEPFAPWLT
jgi:hypothetical protein